MAAPPVCSAIGNSYLFEINLLRTAMLKMGKDLDAPDFLGVHVIHDTEGQDLHFGGTPKEKGVIAHRLRNHT